MHILLAEDDQRMARAVARGLEQEGHVVAVVHDGDAALAAAHDGGFDLLVLDVMMPCRDGFRVVQALRADGVGTPALLLTARGEVEDRVRGLDVGADDYLVKPFAIEELMARVRALLRRGTHRDAPVLRVHTLELDRTARTVRRDGKVITLTTKEFSLLEYLMRQPGVVHTRSMIAEHVWDFTLELGSNVVDVYVKHLRDKIDDKDRPDRPSFVQSVRGVGYVPRDPDADQA